METFRSAIPPYPGPLPRPHPSIPSAPIFELLNNCDVSYGLSFSAACALHAEKTFHAKRVFIIASASLARSTSALDELVAALANKVAGKRAHTYFNEVISIAEECKALDVDLIVTLGGGTLSDAAKTVSLALANNVTDHDHLLRLPTVHTIGTVPPGSPPRIPVICIATTLSAGEFTLGAGVTDDRDNQKHQFLFPKAVHLVIFDAELVARTTPSYLLLQSGVRAIDHCIEPLCSPACNEVSAMHGKAGLELLVPALLRCAADPDGANVEARHMAQLGAIEAIACSTHVYTPPGASHGIGHMLGPFGVGHGATSAILLPAVCDYNARVEEIGRYQRQAVSILWALSEMRQVAERAGLVEGESTLGQLLNALFIELGMPRTLKDIGVGRDQFDKLAEYSLLKIWCPNNSVPLTEKTQVMEILESVVE
ncbi:putative Fe-containing alcohol dehydrogenase [Mycena haematopus]|nr:putative Fe-containing alcohol dehydrogenase [Mycena haematopus]